MDARRLNAIQLGADVNQHGGIYDRGRSYGYAKKVEVALAYKDALEASGGEEPSIRRLMKHCKVSWHFVNKVRKELKRYDRVLRPEEIYQNRGGAKGPGSKTLDNIDIFVIYILYTEEPSRCLASYVDGLEYITGTVVSESTISRLFTGGLPYSARLYRPNLVPLDKLRPDNMEKALEYLVTVALVDPSRIKYGDEKLLKGQELFNRKVRRDPFTGEIPAVYTSPDFRNTYALTGFCGIDTRSPALFFTLHDANNDATQFAIDLQAAINSGFFHPGDILVLDNAAYHKGGENTVLESWLWSRHGIFLLWLPPRCPELNPIEQVWKVLVSRLKKCPLTLVRQIGRHAAAIVASCILAGLTHGEVVGMYRHSGLVW